MMADNLQGNRCSIAMRLVENLEPVKLTGGRGYGVEVWYTMAGERIACLLSEGTDRADMEVEWRRLNREWNKWRNRKGA